MANQTHRKKANKQISKSNAITDQKLTKAIPNLQSRKMSKLSRNSPENTQNCTPENSKTGPKTAEKLQLRI